MPQASHLVGEAVYQVRFPVAAALSPETIRTIQASFGPDDAWQVEVEPSGFSLKTRGYREIGEIAERLHRLSESTLAHLAQTANNNVLLTYSNALPVEPPKIKHLLAERVIAFLSDMEDEFTQELHGTWSRGHYSLNFGVHPLGVEHFRPKAPHKIYLSSAYVTAENVATDNLDNVLRDLDREGLRLLSCPIAPGALETLDLASYLQEGGTNALAGIAQERADLLARKYGHQEFSAADEDRLEALTQRVRSLLPRVAAMDWRTLEDISSRLDEAEKNTRQIQEKYGLAG